MCSVQEPIPIDWPTRGSDTKRRNQPPCVDKLAVVVSTAEVWADPSTPFIDLLVAAPVTTGKVESKRDVPPGIVPVSGEVAAWR
jgi:hypothetical protein